MQGPPAVADRRAVRRVRADAAARGRRRAAAARCADRGRAGRGPVPAAGRAHRAVGRPRPDRQHDAAARAPAAVDDPQRARHRPRRPRRRPQRGHPARRPGAQEIDKVLAILARQNRDARRARRRLRHDHGPAGARAPARLRLIANAAEVAQATAERRAALEADIERLPRFLASCGRRWRGWRVRDEMTPVVADLGAVAPDINRLISELGPFSQAAIPAVEALGDTAEPGIPAINAALPVDHATCASSRAARSRSARRLAAAARVVPEAPTASSA